MAKHITIDYLQTLVESDAWRRDPTIIPQILHEYGKLAAEEPAPNFGTPEFWAVVLGEEDEPETQTGKDALVDHI